MTTNNENATNENATNEGDDDATDFGQLDSDAKQIVKKYMYWSMGASLIPLPLLNTGAVIGVQLKMLGQLSRNYDVDFAPERVKSIIGSLTSVLCIGGLQGSGLTTFLKSIPIVGTISSLSLTIYTGALSYALGVVFTQHFASGGTFLDFNPQEVRDHFNSLFEEGQDEAAQAEGEGAKA
ncbi:MAG: DUF697 domain-containing protein [bacterium]|nr:DUF697 domain-containing protein [bacterium]